ncbi:hypothetical protein, partial [Azotobacter armeniacus]
LEGVVVDCPTIGVSFAFHGGIVSQYDNTFDRLSKCSKKNNPIFFPALPVQACEIQGLAWFGTAENPGKFRSSTQEIALCFFSKCPLKAS